MHFFFASSTDVPHGVPLGEAWFAWLSEGVAGPDPEGLSQGTIIFIGVAAGVAGIILLFILVRVCVHFCNKDKLLDYYYDKFGK
jgi:hypothetical protein